MTDAVMEIALESGNVVLVDAADYPMLSAYRWFLHKNRHRLYAARRSNSDLLLMHRIILGAAPGELVDHISRDGLDNRRVNIRIAGYSLNNHNRYYRNSLGFRGVKKADGGYSASINHRRKKEYLGYFKTIEGAAKAYDAAAIRIYGPDAVTNFGGRNAR